MKNPKSQIPNSLAMPDLAKPDKQIPNPNVRKLDLKIFISTLNNVQKIDLKLFFSTLNNVQKSNLKLFILKFKQLI